MRIRECCWVRSTDARVRKSRKFRRLQKPALSKAACAVAGMTMFGALTPRARPCSR